MDILQWLSTLPLYFEQRESGFVQLEYCHSTFFKMMNISALFIFFMPVSVKR